MGGEPWTFTPAEIGKLTDWQIWELYVRPAVRRSRQARGAGRKRKNRGDSDIPGREAYIAMGCAFGGTPEHWAKEYDTWAASEEGHRVIAEEAEKKARRKRR